MNEKRKVNIITFKSYKLIVSIFILLAVFLSFSIYFINNKNSVKIEQQEEQFNNNNITKGKLIGGIYYAAAGEQTGASEAPIESKGAIYIKDGAEVTISEGAVISGHEALYGGAIYVARGGHLTIRGGTITNNTSRLGGAIYVESGGTLTISGGTITGNYSEPIDNAIGSEGEETAAIYVESGTTVDISGEYTIKDNIPQYYGNYIVYNVDGKETYHSIGYSESTTFDLSLAPLDYEHCCGYFSDAIFMTGVEEGANLLTTQEYTTNTGKRFTIKTSGLYTRTATPDKLKFTYSIGVYNIRQVDTTKTTGVVVVPRQYNGKNVTTIFSASSSSLGAFNNNNNITAVYLPNTLINIGNYAFIKSSANATLKTVTIPNSVTRISQYAFYNCSGLTNVTIPEGVTSIGDYAFYNCSGLTNVTIPEGVTIIENNAFDGCGGLTSIEVDVNNTVYDSRDNCNAIIEKSNNALIAGCQNTIIPDSVTSIVYSAFSGCRGLTSITIPENVTSIGYNAFSDCSGLTEINWNARKLTTSLTSSSNIFYNAGTSGNGITVTFWESVQSIPSYLFYVSINSYKPNITSVAIGANVTSIGDFAFRGCSGLTSITIPEGVTSIGDYAFDGCSGLTSITIPEGVTSIGNSAFSGCSGLTSITIPEGVTSIEYNTFSGCSGLTSITIPEGVTSIGRNAFDGCSGFTSITIPDSVTSIGMYAFLYCDNLVNIYYTGYIAGWCEISFGMYWIISSWTLYINNIAVTELTIPDSVTSIGFYAFFGCSGFTSVTIGSVVTSIGDYAFSGCSGLTSITIPEGVTSIGNSAFSGCSGLTSITIPYSVTSIGRWAFQDCTNLANVTFLNTSGWYVTRDETASSGTNVDVSNPSTNATNLKKTYRGDYWKRNAS